MIGPIFGLIGVILGFLLSEWATHRREERTVKRQARSARAMLSLEIVENLDMLRDFWDKANQVDESEDDSERARLVRRAHRLIELPLPQWNHRVWESQISLLPIVLSAEEVRQVHHFHTQLDRLISIRSTLSALKSEYQEERRSLRGAQTAGAMGLSLSLSWEFDKRAGEFWTDFQQLASEMLDKGNPLRDQTHNGGYESKSWLQRLLGRT